MKSRRSGRGGGGARHVGGAKRWSASGWTTLTPNKQDTNNVYRNVSTHIETYRNIYRNIIIQTYRNVSKHIETWGRSEKTVSETTVSAALGLRLRTLDLQGAIHPYTGILQKAKSKN